MQHWGLTVNRVLEYAARWHPTQEVVCRTVEGPIVISSYQDLDRRSRLCALALQQLGIRLVHAIFSQFGHRKCTARMHTVLGGFHHDIVRNGPVHGLDHNLEGGSYSVYTSPSQM